MSSLLEFLKIQFNSNFLSSFCLWSCLYGAVAEKYLRTLTIIAFKQPILKSLVVKIRGSGAYEHIKYLLDNGLVAAMKKGRSKELTTTDKYSEMFGLPKDKEELKRVMIAQLGLDEISPKNEEDSQE